MYVSMYVRMYVPGFHTGGGGRGGNPTPSGNFPPLYYRQFFLN